VIEQRDPALRLSPLLPLAAQLATARVLHVDATHPELSLRTARRARELQAVVSIDVDLVAGKVSAAAAELCALADLCVVPAGLPEALTGESEPIAALQALSRHSAGLVVVTLGAEGCLAIADDKLYHQPALLPPGRLVDTTACGDTFRAALIAALLRCAAAPTVDDPLPAALRFACAAAALKCLQRGRRGCPSLAAVDQFLLQDGASR
jgi:sugar/nucleoside kinase (ribokinase family)